MPYHVVYLRWEKPLSIEKSFLAAAKYLVNNVSQFGPGAAFEIRRIEKRGRNVTIETEVSFENIA